MYFQWHFKAFETVELIYLNKFVTWDRYFAVTKSKPIAMFGKN